MLDKQVFDLKDKVIIITGGAGLLGREYVRALSDVGAYIVIVDINQPVAENLLKELPKGKAIYLSVDITDSNSVNTMAENVFNRFGRIDGLVNNAALDPKFDQQHTKEHNFKFEEYPISLWEKGLKVNLTGMFLCTQAVAPIMLSQEQGSIVNISSTYGLVGPDQRLYKNEHTPNKISYKPVIYSVTKSAVIGFTRYLATYWAGKGIRVNTLTLGGVYNDHEEGFVYRYSQRTPLGRMAHKNEYNGALIFLLSSASSYMTGSNLIVDGGWTAW